MSSGERGEGTLALSEWSEFFRWEGQGGLPLGSGIRRGPEQMAYLGGKRGAANQGDFFFLNLPTPRLTDFT